MSGIGCILRGAFNRDCKDAVFIEVALTDFYLEVMQNSGVFLTHRFFDTSVKGRNR